MRRWRLKRRTWIRRRLEGPFRKERISWHFMKASSCIIGKHVKSKKSCWKRQKRTRNSFKCKGIMLLKWHTKSTNCNKKLSNCNKRQPITTCYLTNYQQRVTRFKNLTKKWLILASKSHKFNFPWLRQKTHLNKLNRNLIKKGMKIMNRMRKSTSSHKKRQMLRKSYHY